MMIHPKFNPVAISIDPIAIRWYALSYIVGFMLFLWLGRRRIKQGNTAFTQEMLDDFLTWGVLGVILGGRLGYILFYKFSYYLDHPLEMLKVWEGGMSFHGGLIGVMLATWLFGRRNGKSFFQLMDFIAPLVPIGLGAGRIGNFINAELWGKVTDVPWAMVFPNGGPDPRHPSQLYQFALEGVALFVILWLYSRKPRPTMAVSGLFAICYGIFRFIVEFVRVPDAQLGYLAWNWLTMGQVLCLPMILGGIGLIAYAYKRQPVQGAA